LRSTFDYGHWSPETEDALAMTTFPGPGVELTQLLVVSDINRSRDFYTRVLGAELFREYGGTSCVLKFQGCWLLLVTGGGPTEDKPDVTFAPPPNPGVVSHQLTMRVPDCHEAYRILSERGARFLTPPFERGSETRCFFRDPDGHLLEISALSS
jgi:catechol 2,3-dioxygenase-like lactoylglutathione lyase family enzyme